MHSSSTVIILFSHWIYWCSSDGRFFSKTMVALFYYTTLSSRSLYSAYKFTKPVSGGWPCAQFAFLSFTQRIWIFFYFTYNLIDKRYIHSCMLKNNRKKKCLLCFLHKSYLMPAFCKSASDPKCVFVRKNFVRWFYGINDNDITIILYYYDIILLCYYYNDITIMILL